MPVPPEDTFTSIIGHSRRKTGRWLILLFSIRMKRKRLYCFFANMRKNTMPTQMPSAWISSWSLLSWRRVSVLTVYLSISAGMPTVAWWSWCLTRKFCPICKLGPAENSVFNLFSIHPHANWMFMVVAIRSSSSALGYANSHKCGWHSFRLRSLKKTHTLGSCHSRESLPAVLV